MMKLKSKFCIFLTIFLSVTISFAAKNIRGSAISSNSLPLYGKQTADEAALILIRACRSYAKSTSYVDLQEFNVVFNENHELTRANMFFPFSISKKDLDTIENSIKEIATKQHCTLNTPSDENSPLPTVTCPQSKNITYGAYISDKLITVRPPNLS